MRCSVDAATLCSASISVVVQRVCENKALSPMYKCVVTQTYTYASRQLYPCSSVVTFIRIQLHIWPSCHNVCVCARVCGRLFAIWNIDVLCCHYPFRECLTKKTGVAYHRTGDNNICFC